MFNENSPFGAHDLGTVELAADALEGNYGLPNVAIRAMEAKWRAPGASREYRYGNSGEVFGRKRTGHLL
jgi:hypothetical protein